MAIGSEGETENSKIQMPHDTEKIDRSKKLKERKTTKCLRIRKNNTQQPKNRFNLETTNRQMNRNETIYKIILLYKLNIV